MESANTSGNQEPTFVLRIGGEDLDLRDYPPITHGDRKTVKKEPYNLNLRNMKDWDEDQETSFALFLLKRVRAKTTAAEIDLLPAKTVQDLIGYCMRKSAEVQNPFSMPSTFSAAGTDGARASSSAAP